MGATRRHGLRVAGLGSVAIGSKEAARVDTLYDVLDRFCQVPVRSISAPSRMPIAGIYKIRGAGAVTLAQAVSESKEVMHADTLYDVLDKFCRAPLRPISAPIRMPISRRSCTLIRSTTSLSFPD